MPELQSEVWMKQLFDAVQPFFADMEEEEAGVTILSAQLVEELEAPHRLVLLIQDEEQVITNIKLGIQEIVEKNRDRPSTNTYLFREQRPRKEEGS